MTHFNAISNASSSFRVGVLNSLTGAMSGSERLVAKVMQLAIEEINAGGGVLGRKIVAIVRDGESCPERFALQARALCEQEQVSVIF